MAALVCTLPIMSNVWEPECPDSPTTVSLWPGPELSSSWTAGPEGPEPCAAAVPLFPQEEVLGPMKGRGLCLELEIGVTES